MLKEVKIVLILEVVSLKSLLQFLFIVKTIEDGLGVISVKQGMVRMKRGLSIFHISHLNRLWSLRSIFLLLHLLEILVFNK